MDKEKIESLIIDYIDGKLSEEERTLLEKELSENKEAHTLYEQMREVMQVMEKSAQLEPSHRLRKNFDQVLRDELMHQQPTRTIFFQPVIFRAAAAIALVMTGVAIGYWMNKNQQRENELAAIKQQMEEMKTMMLSKLDNQLSASQRMIGVSVAYEMEKADDEIVHALVKTMNEDPNTNVRLAALEALSKFREEPEVKKALLKSLGSQKDPVVQIALIQLLVKMKEKGVVNDLKRIVDDNKSMKAVKDEAYTGLLRLS